MSLAACQKPTPAQLKILRQLQDGPVHGSDIGRDRSIAGRAGTTRVWYRLQVLKLIKPSTTGLYSYQLTAWGRFHVENAR